MPEGDAVRRLGVSLTDVFAGEGIHVSSPQGRFASSAARIDGWTFSEVSLHGKQMFIGFVPQRDCEETQDWVHIHLGLYGTWRFSADESHPQRGPVMKNHAAEEAAAAARPGPVQSHKGERWNFFVEDGGVWTPPEPVGQVRMRLETDYAIADLVGPNKCALVSDEERIATLAKLGPDPLMPGAAQDQEACERFVSAVRSKKRAIGELMMDQSIIAGVGNIYRADILFIAGISPMRAGNRISEARLRHLWELTCMVMKRGYDARRLDTIDPADAPAELIIGDEEASRWYVYHRTGRACLKCGTPVAEKLMQNRRLFWCPSCQK